MIATSFAARGSYSLRFHFFSSGVEFGLYAGLGSDGMMASTCVSHAASFFFRRAAGRIAVKVINHPDDEVMKVFRA